MFVIGIHEMLDLADLGRMKMMGLNEKITTFVSHA